MGNNVILITTAKGEAGTLDTLPEEGNLSLLSELVIVEENVKFGHDDKVCIVSESSIEIAKSALTDSAKINAITKLKDKYLFRKILEDGYDGYKFRSIVLSEIESLNVENRSVLKPNKGCFGSAVRIIDSDTDLPNLKYELEQELLKNSTVFSSEVLSQDDFILEDYINGEEYAVDMFYDRFGKPRILNIYHHPIPEHVQYLHMIYYSSKEVFELIYPKAMAFFETLNQTLNVTNFPMHCEFKIDGDQLYPIEINSMRFGGMGLGNLVYHTMGINPYDHFLDDLEPRWNSIWRNHDTDIFVHFIAYNASSKSVESHRPNTKELKNQFTEILLERLFDYRKQLAFGIYCLKETRENLDRLLTIDFDDFFELSPD